MRQRLCLDLRYNGKTLLPWLQLIIISAEKMVMILWTPLLTLQILSQVSLILLCVTQIMLYLQVIKEQKGGYWKLFSDGFSKVRLTWNILFVFRLSLTCRDGCIYVKRHCRSVLFWSTSEDGTRCEKLERDVETKIFDLDRFRQHLRQYYEGSIPSPVIPEINFSIAQKLCDAFELKACFISFVVRPLRAVEELRTLNNDARSLPHSSHSGLLKFSGPEMHNDVFATTSVSPLLAQAAAGLGPWGDMSPYAASCPMVPQPALTQVQHWDSTVGGE